MEVLNYDVPNRPCSVGWFRRYIIGGSVIAVCHFLGSIVCYLNIFVYWDVDPHPLFDRFFYAYESPMLQVSQYCGLLKIDGGKSFLVSAALNAVLWGCCFVGTWHLASVIQRARSVARLKDSRP
jgi:hypothetical protein